MSISFPAWPADLRGLVESGALLPGSHAARQAEEDAPVSDDQLRHEGHFDKHGGAGRQVADADGEHILSGKGIAEGQQWWEDGANLV